MTDVWQRLDEAYAQALLARDEYESRRTPLERLRAQVEILEEAAASGVTTGRKLTLIQGGRDG